MNTYVDGELLEANVLAQLCRVVLARIIVFVGLVLAMASVFLYLWIKFEPDKLIDTWVETHMEAEAS